MGLFTKKILEYQQKKLDEAKHNLQSHLTKKEQLLGILGSDKELAYEEKMIKIWTKNIDRITQEINKVQNKK